MKSLLLALFLFIAYNSYSQKCEGDYILNKDLKKDSIMGYFFYYSYLDTCGNVVIPDKKYALSFTDRFETIAFVLKENDGLIAIDKKENRLFNVVWSNNGPDQTSEGLFRITEHSLMGYADLNGNVIIPPQFQCAYPFKDGKAKVSNTCKTTKDGENLTWVSNNWYYIDQTGKYLK